MAIDYFVLCQGDVTFDDFVLKLGQRIKLAVEENSGNTLRLAEVSGIMALFARRHLAEGEYMFEQHLDYDPGTVFSVRLDKRRRVAGKQILARVVKTAISCTSESVTVLINGETLLLEKRRGEQVPVVYINDFWAERDVQMLLER